MPKPTTASPDAKGKLIATLRECAQLLELKGANTFRVRAYENGARALEAVAGDPTEWIAAGMLKGIKGIGAGMLAHVEEFVQSGQIALHAELSAEIPPGLLEMVQIPGIGPKKIKLVWEKLKIDSIEALEAGAKRGEVAALPGFGEKTAEKILAGIELIRKFAGRRRIDVALAAAERVLAAMKELPAVKKIETAGSLRRMRETIGDLDFVVDTAEPEVVMEAFTTLPFVERVVARGPTKSSVILFGGVPADLRAITSSEYAAALLYFTGSKEHNTHLRGRAKKMDMRLNEYGLYKEGSEKTFPCPDEAAIYKKLGLAYIEPEMREDMGEIEAAESGKLPNLISQKDMHGLLHCHSTYSDGRATLEEMTEGARAAGYQYFGICDHSQSAAYAGGIKEDKVLRQHEEVDRLNERLKGFTVLKGIESDILAGGELDYPDKLLERFDFVVASVHSRFSQDRDAMTRRICNAISHPATAILGHATGRLLLERDPFQVDLDEVFATAAKHKVAIEINGDPHRLDLDWREIRKAKAAGCIFTINPDAHSVPGIGNVRFGVAMARKGWLGPQDVINTKTLADFRKWLKSRR